MIYLATKAAEEERVGTRIVERTTRKQQQQHCRESVHMQSPSPGASCCWIEEEMLVLVILQVLLLLLQLAA